MNTPLLSDDELQMLRRLSASGSPTPWRSFIEKRDHLSGSDFIMVGESNGRGDDMHVTRDGTPASADDLDLIAASRTFLPRLLDEIARLRRETGS
jgi:hypothetical protein